MYFVLVPLSLILLWLIFYSLTYSIRHSLLLAVITCGVILCAITEILSLFRELTFAGLLVSWGLVCVVLIAILFRINPDLNLLFRSRFRRLPAYLLIFGAGIVFIIAVIGFTAIVSPPNNWDAMFYHMPRVFFWTQHQSVSHYPTFIDQQLHQPPLAEFAITHLQVLSGGDYLANLLQWFAMGISVIGVSLIVRVVGGDARVQVLASVLCVTLPMGIMQGASTQNDYVLSMWIVCLTYFVVRSVKQKSITWSDVIVIGSSAALAILTKGTAYVYVFPLLSWFVFVAFSRLRWQVWKHVVVIAALILTVNSGHYLRNYAVFDSPLARRSLLEFHSNDIISLPVVLSNTSRNLAMNVYVPDAVNDVYDFREGIVSTLHEFHDFIGMDISDPRTSLLRSEFTLWEKWQVFHEDFSANPVHLLLILGTTIIYPFLGRKRSNPTLTTYLIVLWAQFLLLSLVFKWQPWGIRLQLPFLVTMSVFIAVVINRLAHRYFSYMLMGGLLLLAQFWLFNSLARPLLPQNSTFIFSVNYADTAEINPYPSIIDIDRASRYFRFREEIEEHYYPVVKFPTTFQEDHLLLVDYLAAQDCSDIGLINYGEWEYPLLILLHNRLPGLYVQHVGVFNETEVLYYEKPFSDFVPCAVVVVLTSQQNGLPDIFEAPYHLAWSTSRFFVFEPIAK